jgi:hypothetical protein
MSTVLQHADERMTGTVDDALLAAGLQLPKPLAKPVAEAGGQGEVRR